MRAVVLLQKGSVDELKLQELPDPVAGAGEVVVRLKAAALNHRDAWIRQGLYAKIRLPAVLGSDGAGVVESVGPGADAAWVGKRVVLEPSYGWGPDPKAQGREFLIRGMPAQGTLAERIALPAEQLAEIPAHLGFEEAAALPVAGLTAYRALVTRGRVAAGEHVLITGIGGGVATLALVFARALGAKVSVTSSSAEKLASARELGAVAAADYREEGWDKKLLAEVGAPPSLIVDGAGGAGFNALLGAAAPGGRIVVYGATRGPVSLDFPKLFFKQVDVLGSTMGTPGEFRDMLALVARHELRPVIDRVFPLSEAVAANRRLEESEQMGKIVLDCSR